MKAKHTPGPWETGGVMTLVEVLPKGWNVPMCIADCHTKNAPKSEAERVANARLIAAAPELLEVVYLYLELSPDQPPNLTAMARAAIARAEGTPEVRELPTDDDLSERTGLNMEDWVEDVRQGNTKLGYSDWLQHNAESMKGGAS